MQQLQDTAPVTASLRSFWLAMAPIDRDAIGLVAFVIVVIAALIVASYWPDWFGTPRPVRIRVPRRIQSARGESGHANVVRLTPRDEQRLAQILDDVGGVRLVSMPHVRRIKAQVH